MSLPRPPISATTPIPNQPFASPEVYYLEGNQGHLPLGPGLYIDPATGGFTDIEPSPYIYCTPQYGNLPVSYPPYGCNTEVNTAGVTDLSLAWDGCSSLTSFPCIDTSSAEILEATWNNCSSLTSFPKLNTSSTHSFFCTWQSCSSLTSFPKLNTSSGQMFGNAWNSCTSLTSFPNIEVGNGTFFGSAWAACTSLTSFPPLNFSSGTVFNGAWQNCFNLTEFPAGVFDYCPATMFVAAWAGCALNQTSVDNILISINNAGTSGGTLSLNGGTSAAPGAAGLAAKAALQARGWTVLTN